MGGGHRAPALANEKAGCPVKSEFQTMNTLLVEVCKYKFKYVPRNIQDVPIAEKYLLFI